MKKSTVILWMFIIVKLVAHYFLINPAYDLHRDEYLHLDQAKHLAWGFESVPPFTSWISLIILYLGDGVFWIKFFPALFGALTIAVVWKSVEALKGNLFAMILSATAILFSVILRLNILYQPNSFDVLCWTTFYFTIIKYINSQHRKWLYYAAVVIAIGFLNKYNILFLVMGMLPALLLTEHRKILLRKQFYFALGIALLIVLPNLVWQYRHGFPVVHHMKTLADTQLVNVNRSDFLKEQVLYFLGSLYILIAAFYAFLFYPPFKQYRLFGWSFLFSLLIFIFLKAKGYYAIGLYPIFISFGAVYLEQAWKSGWKFYLRPVAILVILVVFIPMLKLAFPLVPPADIQRNEKALKDFGMLRWEDGKDHALPQDFADMRGWKELAHKTDSIFASLNAPENTLVLCDNYGQAGAINYYSKYKDIQAVSMNADYINWFPLQKEIKHVVLVQESSDDDPGRKRERTLFKSVLLAGQIEDQYAREYGTKIYLLKDALTSINKILEDEIAKEKMNQ
ncbi:MAG: glycosyltransferase family 39 protein [Ferruginibacter sp.]